MLRFNGNTIERVVIPLSHMERRELIEAPISINHYGGKSFCGHCPMLDKDTAHARYLKAFNMQRYSLDVARQEPGYLP